MHAVVPEEGDERVEGVKGIGGNLLDRVSEGRLSKGHLVFAREGLDLMEEVVRGDEEDGHRSLRPMPHYVGDTPRHGSPF